MKNIFIIGLVLMLVFGFCSVYATNNTTNDTEDINITNSSVVAFYNSTVFNNSTVNNTVIYVSTGGNDSNDGLTVKTSKRTIQNAINTIPTNGSVYIKSGTYHENIKLNKSMSLIGIDKNVKIDGDFKDSCIVIKENYTVSLEKLTLQRGWNTGLINHGQTNINHVTIKDNAAENNGGILNTGTMNIVNSKITNNNIKGDNAGICNEGYLTITNMEINDNKAGRDCGGIYSNGNLTITNTEINDNKAGDDCGGIMIEGEGCIRNSKINHNKANNYTGGLNNNGVLFIINSQINYNTCEGYIGNLMNSGNLNITGSEVIGNTADIKPHFFKGETIQNEGGGISNYGFMNINKCKINKNSAWEGGGICNQGSMNINKTLIIGNSANNRGGGIYNSGGNLNISNSQIIGNTADEFWIRNFLRVFESTWSVWAKKKGGGIYNSGNSRVDNCVISGNHAGQHGGGIYTEDSFMMNNSVVNDNWCWNEGGGIWGDGHIFNTEIKGNIACCKGGGIYGQDYGPPELEFVKVYSNFAPKHGGVVNVNYDARSEIKGNLFTNS